MRERERETHTHTHTQKGFHGYRVFLKDAHWLGCWVVVWTLDSELVYFVLALLLGCPFLDRKIYFSFYQEMISLVVVEYVSFDMTDRSWFCVLPQFFRGAVIMS